MDTIVLICAIIDELQLFDGGNIAKVIAHVRIHVLTFHSYKTTTVLTWCTMVGKDHASSPSSTTAAPDEAQCRHEDAD